MKLDSALVFTNDIKKSVEFYKNIIGLEVDYVQERFASFFFENGVRLGTKVPTKDREVPGHQTIFIEAGDIQDMLRDMKAKDLPLYEDLGEIKGWGKYFSILDPDGNKILFIEHKK